MRPLDEGSRLLAALIMGCFLRQWIVALPVTTAVLRLIFGATTRWRTVLQLTRAGLLVLEYLVVNPTLRKS